MTFEEIATPVDRQPWIGANYRNLDRRLLIVGESHYGESPNGDKYNYTKDTVAEYVAGEWTTAFFTNISQVITGKKRWEIDMEQLWSQVSFHNFLQQHMSGPREAPKAREDWESGIPILHQVIRNLTPTHILILGFRLKGWITYLDTELCIDPNPGKASLWKYGTGQAHRVAKVAHIRHPSSGFSSEYWHPLVSEFLTSSNL